MKPSALAASALLIVLTGSASGMELPLGGARFEVPVTSLKQLRFSATMRQHYDFSCGSAALATLLTHHYGHPVSEQRVFEQMYLHGDQRKIRKEGFSMLDMQRYLAARGYRADGFKLPLHKLVEAKLPAIVLVSDKGYHHFVVIKGVAQERVLMGDPSSGARALSLAAFDAIWVGKLLFVVHGYANTTSASMPGANMPGANMPGSNMPGSNMPGSNMPGVTTPAAIKPGFNQPSFNKPTDWRAAPAAPLASVAWRDALAPLMLAKLGPGDF